MDPVGDFLSLVAWLWPERWLLRRRGIISCILLTMILDVMVIYIIGIALGHVH